MARKQATPHDQTLSATTVYTPQGAVTDVVRSGAADHAGAAACVDFVEGSACPVKEVQTVLRWRLRQVCDALREAHAVGLIHRDIKPGNVFSAHRGGVYDVAKLLDFGLVKPIAEIESAQLTIEGAMTGSPHYMAPEQATEGTADERSDIYALGATAYFMLTGRPPFEHDKALKVILAHASEKVIPPSELQTDVPHDLEQVVLQCLEKAPADRFQNVEQLDAALAACESAGQWSRQDARRWWEAVEQQESQLAEATLA